MFESQSVEIKDLAAALAKAQGKIGGAVRSSSNPFHKNQYAPYDSVREACESPLSENGIMLSHYLNVEGGQRVLVTQLTHSSGQWMRSFFVLPSGEKETMQTIGSSVTYAKRYSLLAFLAIPCRDSDDDGEAAEPRNVKSAPVQVGKLSAKQVETINKFASAEQMKNILASYRTVNLESIGADQFQIIMTSLTSKGAV